MKSKLEDIRRQLQEEMKSLERRRTRAVKLIARIDQRMRALVIAAGALSRDLAGGEVGIPIEAIEATNKEFEVTASIRQVLDSSAEVLSAPEIRDALISKGWKADAYKNPLAVVHTVLRRLTMSGDVFVDPHHLSKKGFYGKILAAKRREERRKWEAKNAELTASEDARARLRRTLPAACYEVLRGFPKGMTATEIREKLAENGFDAAYAAHRHFPNDIYSALTALGHSQGQQRVRKVAVVRGGRARAIYQLMEGGNASQVRRA